MRPGKKRLWLGGSLCLTGLFLVGFGQPLYLLSRAWYHDRPQHEAAPPGFTDDASRLNRTQVAEVWDVPPEPAAAEAQLRRLLERARADGLGVALAGARHSMGGHTICPDGVVVNMLPFRRLELDKEARLLRAGAGARWSEVIPYLDERGFSVGVMQSNNDFSVGGSLSVNCHGWPCNRPPIASTVEALRVMLADGRVRRCSRAENAELFGLVLGGYGLCGIILEAELRVVPAERYRLEAEVLPTGRYTARFAERADDTAGMAYGRLCVTPGPLFLREAIQTVFRREAGPVPPLEKLSYHGLRREIYRAQIGSNAGKELRWRAEKLASERMQGKVFSRNQLLNEPAEVYQEQNADRTDLLHEYFIPVARFEEFLGRARAIVPRHQVDLLNVTVRNVREDRDSFLRYADQDQFAFVMLFNHPRAAEAEPAMEAFTRAMIDAALDCGGRYYLPYRLHATPEQFRRAYPQAATFFARKREYDPAGLFRNQFYAKYAAP